MNGKVRISLYRVTCTYVLIFALFSGSSSLIASYCPKTSYALFGNFHRWRRCGFDNIALCDPAVVGSYRPASPMMTCQDIGDLDELELYVNMIWNQDYESTD